MFAWIQARDSVLTAWLMAVFKVFALYPAILQNRKLRDKSQQARSHHNLPKLDACLLLACGDAGLSGAKKLNYGS